MGLFKMFLGMYIFNRLTERNRQQSIMDDSDDNYWNHCNNHYTSGHDYDPLKGYEYDYNGYSDDMFKNSHNRGCNSGMDFLSDPDDMIW